jgi:hypothetical protein
VSDNMSDFDKQMAEIDQAMSAMPEPAPVPAPAVAKRVAPSQVPATGRREVISVWFRLVLVTLLAVGLTVWPYQYQCGWGLLAYLGAAGVTFGTGLWTTISTWRLRLAVPHVLSLLVTLAGLVLLVHEVALRVGYAAAHQTWLCP